MHILLVAIIILSLPLGELIRLDLGNSIFLKPLDLIVVITAILVTFWKLITRSIIKYSKSSSAILAFCIIGLLSLILNYYNLTKKEFVVAFLYWLRFISYSVVYIVIINIDKKYFKLITSLLLLSGTIILLLGFVQFFLYPNLQNLYYLGWDEHNYRMFTVFLDPNFAGAFFVLFTIYILGQIYKTNRIADKYKFFFLSVLALVNFAAIFLTYSRSAILMLSVSLITLFILINKKKFIYVFILTFTIIIAIISPTFDKENTNLLRTTSSLARINSYMKAIEVIKINPFIGIGFNAYRYIDVEENITSTKINYQEHAGAGVDNSFLFVFATTGIIGLLSYIYFWYTVLKRAIYLKTKSSNIEAIIVIGSTIGLLINSFFINSLFYPSLLLWMWIQLGLMEK